MKKFIIFLISVVFFFHTFLLAYSSDPKEFVDELISEAITILSKKIKVVNCVVHGEHPIQKRENVKELVAPTRLLSLLINKINARNVQLRSSLMLKQLDVSHVNLTRSFIIFLK